MSSNRQWKAGMLLLLLQPFSVLADEDLAEIEQIAALPPGFSPRFFGDALPIQPFAKRQDTGVCPSGGHSCAEIGEAAADKCCAVDKYCYYKPDWNVGCCGFGTTCDPQCSGTLYRTNITMPTTMSTTVTPTTTQSGATGVVLVSTLTTSFEACVNRKCPISQYLCPSSMGGGCCNNNEVCASGSSCLSTVSSTPTLVPTRGCSGTTSATDCATGGGCCLIGQTCVATAGVLGCAGTPDGPAGSNVTSSQPLSQGAKAGIGAGVAIGAAIVIGLLTWFCIRRRREARTATSGVRSRSRGQTPGPDNSVVGGGGVAAMSEVSGPSRGARRHNTGLVYEYLGPNAVPGPYTLQDDDVHDVTPDVARDRGGVPVSEWPHGPGDIHAPVEIGAPPEKPKEEQREPDHGADDTANVAAIPAGEQGEHEGQVFELEAPFPEPSPMSHDEFQSAHGSPPISPPGGTMRTDYLG